VKKITQTTIAQVVSEIVSACKPHKVILFGSHGRGSPGKDSDIDLLIVADIAGASSERFRYVQRAITSKGFGIDTIVRTPEEFEKAMEGRDWFIQEIVKRGKVLYAR